MHALRAALELPSGVLDSSASAFYLVIPAQAEIHSAFAKGDAEWISRLRGNDTRGWFSDTQLSPPNHHVLSRTLALNNNRHRRH